ncbi:MAG: fatty acid desaturase [Lentisphaerae bacterium]|nr:fatty acid desaturase [Lentisphaerota bacterium]
MKSTPLSDYSLTGRNTRLAIENGLAEATWYAPPVPREEMRKLLERRDGPAIRDTLIWFALILGSGAWAFMLWGSWWAIIPFAIYGVLYGSTSDSRWHESSHGTAFKTDWMNNVLYEIASFMVMRESTRWRWSHTRHHSDTLIVGRDMEIAVPRPPSLLDQFLGFLGINAIRKFFPSVIMHSGGKLAADEKTFIPESEYGKVFLQARIYVLIYLSVIGLSLYLHSLLPLMFIGLPNLYGAWLMPIYGRTQHAGLAENTLDHRLNCRTVYMNAINRFLYWEMNYHTEHHIFPLVPYHNLAKLHALVKADLPKPYNGLMEAWREIIPAILRQRKDPTYFIERELPTPTVSSGADTTSHIFKAKGEPIDGWVEICDSHFLKTEDVIRFDHAAKTYAVYRAAAGSLHATDGVCTHSNAHLADGFVSDTTIECAKHNGRFEITDGSPKRMPVCVGLTTYKVREHDEKIFLDLNSAGGAGVERAAQTHTFRVVSNDNVATFIKELVLNAESPGFNYQPGEYLQFDIPPYGEMPLNKISVTPPFDTTWRDQGVFDLRAENTLQGRRNYSMATPSEPDKPLRFNVRISLPPRGQDYSAGAGSSYLHQLQPGDTITAVGPFGDFLIKPTANERVYLGGGAGMAPLRAHLSHLLETEKTEHRVSFWYGARSLQESFYTDYFEGLAQTCPNFSFNLALSEPQPEDDWQSHTGFIHEVLLNNHLANHPDPTAIDFYLCGPPAMIEASIEMLKGLNVPMEQIAYDEF